MHRGRFKTPTALGETLGKIFSDRGSIPLISTNSVTIAYAVVTFSVYDNSHSYVGNFVVMVRYNVKKTIKSRELSDSLLLFVCGLYFCSKMNLLLIGVSNLFI